MITFFTNLDEAKPYVDQMNDHHFRPEEAWKGWPPAIGHLIEFKVHRFFTFQLEVIAVTHNSTGTETRVELHLGRRWSGRSIKDWMEWFQRGKERRE